MQSVVSERIGLDLDDCHSIPVWSSSPRTTLDVLCVALDMSAYAAFTESRTRLSDSTKLHRKSGVRPGLLSAKSVQIRERCGFSALYFVERVKTSGSARNQVAGEFPVYPSIGNQHFMEEQTLTLSSRLPRLAVGAKPRDLLCALTPNKGRLSLATARRKVV
jgi:hypothetical protein